MSVSEKYKDWLSSGIYNGLQKVSIPLFGLLSTMLLARKALSVEDMGVWGLFLTITALIDTIRQGLVKTSLIKFINYSESNEHPHVLTAAFYLNAIVTIIIAIILFFSSHFIAVEIKAPKLEEMFYIYQAGLVLLIPFMHFESIIYGKVLFKGLFWTYLVRQGIPLLLMASVFFITKSITLNLLVVFYNVGILLSTVIAYLSVRRVFTKTFTYSKYWMGQLWHFGKYVFGTGLSNMVFRNADQIMLPRLMGSTAFSAFQNVSLRIINLADIPSQVLADILFPKSSHSDNSNNPALIKYYYEKAVGATLSFVLPSVLFILLFPKLFVAFLGGAKYYPAIPYLQLVSFSVIFLAFIKHYGVIIDSTGRPKVNFATTTLIAVIQVIACYFFIKYYGLMGAGYALLFTHVIGFIVTQNILWRYFRINFINCFKYAFEFYPELFKIFKEKIRGNIKSSLVH